MVGQRHRAPCATVPPRSIEGLDGRQLGRDAGTRPFSTVAIAMGEPFTVPAGANADTIRAATADLEARLVRLEARARAMLKEGAQ